MAWSQSDVVYTYTYTSGSIDMLAALVDLIWGPNTIQYNYKFKFSQTQTPRSNSDYVAIIYVK